MSTTKIQIGDVTIHRIVEFDTPIFDVMPFFPSLTKELLDENRDWLEPRFLEPGTQKLVLCIQSYLLQTRHHNILIDACVGNHKPRPARAPWNMMTSDRFERNFAATGIGMQDIDYVMCTHMHTDHVGWNTKQENGRWVPTFPKAKYLFADRELEHWTQRYKDNPQACPHVGDSVLPIVEAKRAELVKSDHAFNDHVSLIPTPGHSIDHYSVHVKSKGHEAVVTGDMVHSPLQGRYPEIGMMADFDSKQAGETRRSLFGRFCDTPTLMCTAHFPEPSSGLVRRWGDGFRFVDA